MESEDKTPKPEQGNRAAFKKIKIKAKVVVRDKDGKIKYDNPAKVGKFNEENL